MPIASARLRGIRVASNIAAMRRLFIALGIALAVLHAGAQAADSGERGRTEKLFDPARHIPVREVKAGMKGYGLSVFKGTTPERFEVEVVSILHNQMAIQGDVILVRCRGANLEHTGAIAGMSGSPIYLTDDNGKTRLAGAFAYGWPLAKDPIGGVQPIEYMLDLSASEGLATTRPATQRAAVTAPRWTLAEAKAAIARPGRQQPANALATALQPLQPMQIPLMASGFSEKSLAGMEKHFGGWGMVALQAGGAVGASGAATQPADDVAIVPGSAMVLPILRGDAELSAVGTCTEVIGQRVFGFGHPFSNDGPVNLPMGSGRVSTVIASLASSFKIGSLTKIQGSLYADQQSGVAGRIGAAPALVPIDLEVTWVGSGETRKFHFESIQHPRITPMVTSMAMGAALTGRKQLPQFHTLNYDLEVKFTNGRVVKLHDVAANEEGGPLGDIAGLLQLVTDNPFDAVGLASIKGTIRILPESQAAAVLSVNMPKLSYRPGETVKAFVTCRPFRSAERVLPIEMELPRELPEGTYELVVGDRDEYLSDQQAAQPFRFSAQSVDEVFAVVDDLTDLRSDALYVRLMRQPDGVAIGRTAMPRLPSSRRQILLGAGRSNTTAFVSSTTKVIPTGLVMSGSARFEITIEKDGKSETHGGPTRKPASRPQ